MRRELSSTVERAGTAAWWRRIFAKRQRSGTSVAEELAANHKVVAGPRQSEPHVAADSETEIPAEFEPGIPADPRPRRGLRAYRNTERDENTALFIYYFVVLLGSLGVAYLVQTQGELGWLIAAVALFANAIGFFLVLPASWERDMKVTAALLGVVFPSIFVISAVSGQIRIFG